MIWGGSIKSYSESKSDKHEHALGNKAIAKAINSSDEVVCVSLEEIKVYLEIVVAHLEHLNHVFLKLHVLDSVHLLGIDDSINVGLA
jgi:hypothetical protein